MDFSVAFALFTTEGFNFAFDGVLLLLQVCRDEWHEKSFRKIGGDVVVWFRINNAEQRGRHHAEGEGGTV